MTEPANHVLAAIDNAVRDYELSADAMRWAPDGCAKVAADPSPQLPTERPQHYPSFSEPMRWEQRKTTCTLAEIDAWMAEEHELALHGHAWAEVDAFSLTSIAMRRQHPPCIGCGRPTGTSLDPAMTIDGTNEPRMTATFQPCGCRLTVSVPAILDHIPSGTRPERFAGQVVTGEFFYESADERFVEHVKTRIVQAADERPHVVMALDAGDPLLEQFDSIRHRMMPGDKAVVAFWLRAETGATEHIVYRASPNMTEGDMSPDLEGRWERRPAPSYELLPIRCVVRFGSENFSTATARATGRVEISPEGAVAEVYEVQSDYL